jgi:hypothetical protein
MKTRLVSVGLIVALLSMITLAPRLASAASPAPAPSGIQIPINITNANGAFTGVFTVSRFVLQNGQVAAVGTLTGTVTNAVGLTIGAIVRTLTIPLISIHATCDILHLELGPLDLDLLGLVIHLDKIVLDIDAQSGPGNLLGNLLCAVANLLNNNGPLSQLVNLLNQILGLLT